MLDRILFKKQKYCKIVVKNFIKTFNTSDAYLKLV